MYYRLILVFYEISYQNVILDSQTFFKFSLSKCYSPTVNEERKNEGRHTLVLVFEWRHFVTDCVCQCAQLQNEKKDHGCRVLWLTQCIFSENATILMLSLAWPAIFSNLSLISYF